MKVTLRFTPQAFDGDVSSPFEIVAGVGDEIFVEIGTEDEGVGIKVVAISTPPYDQDADKSNPSN